MLTFEGKPSFLEDYAVAGFEVDNQLGAIGTLVLILHPKAHSDKPEFDDHSRLHGALGEEIKCSCDEWGFTGRVEGVEYDGDDFRLVVRDALSGLTRSYASRVFTGKKLEDIVAATLPTGAAFRCIGDIGGRKIPVAIQYQETNFDFLKRLAAQNGGQLWCYKGEIVVGSEPSSDSVELRLGADFISYSFATQLGLEKVDVNSIAYGEKNKRSSTKVELAGGSFGKIQDSAVDARAQSNGVSTLHIVHEDSSYKDAEGLGEGLLRSQAAGRFTLTGVLKAPVPLGAKAKIDNFNKTGSGDKMTENAVVRSVRGMSATYDEDAQWQVEVANPDALLDPSDLISNHLITSTAIVDESDDSMNRIKVKFPWDPEETVTPWLRVATPSWGKDHVHYIPPRPDDTVLVMWGQFDMDPVVVGAVAAGEEVAEPKHKFVFRTVEGHKVNVDGKKITIVNEADSGGTTVEIAPDSVKVNTKKKQSVEIGSDKVVLKNGGASLTVESGKIVVDAPEVEIKSKGGASVKLSGPQVSVNNGALDVV